MRFKPWILVIGGVLLIVPIVLVALSQTVWREIVVSPVSRPFEATGEQDLGPRLCAHWTVSGTLEGESRSFADGAKWTHGASDIGDVEAGVMSPRLELAFTDGCGGDPVVVDAVQARWGFAPGCTEGDLGVRGVADSEDVPECVLDLSFGISPDGLSTGAADSAFSSYSAANTGRTVAFDGRLPIFDSGFVCFRAIAQLTVYYSNGVYGMPTAMEVCA